MWGVAESQVPLTMVDAEEHFEDKDWVLSELGRLGDSWPELH